MRVAFSHMSYRTPMLFSILFNLGHHPKAAICDSYLKDVEFLKTLQQQFGETGGNPSMTNSNGNSINTNNQQARSIRMSLLDLTDRHKLR